MPVNTSAIYVGRSKFPQILNLAYLTICIFTLDERLLEPLKVGKNDNLFDGLANIQKISVIKESFSVILFFNGAYEF